MFPLSPNFPSRRPFYYNRANRRELGSKEELSPTTMLPRGLALFWAVNLSPHDVLPPPARWTCPLLLAHLAYSTILAIHTLFLASEEDRERSPTSGQLMVLEEAKEILGLAIVAAWSSLLLWDNFLRIGRNKSVLAGCLISAAPLLAWMLIGDEAQYC
ncbi:hypothetical protein Fcan01_14285 [Folsomia candida]|uniref:Uncharacterized protein n=1 Tax=Folsomia candida TaxID=158441 RepID=A0A226E1G5_FOLCA|nr:hypothetical protein Fcan01_14285 [Folsomia candida]